jgi:radical SAM protein with 4Fe4S-binding SPASM domain
MEVLKEHLKLPSDIVIKRKGKKYLFLNPSVPDWVVTNRNGAKALELCNGKRTLKEINRIVSKFCRRDTKHELQNFFDEVISESKLFSSSKLETCIYPLYDLHIIHLNLTNKCNLKCIYCYADERINSNNQLQFRDYLNIIDSINNISKNAEIVLTGGEPLLASYVFDVARYAKKSGNQIHILSNGTLIDEENAKQIAEVSDLIKISLDGSTPEINDIHRGKGTFYRISKAIDILIRENAPLQILMTVTKKNINDIQAMVDKFGSLLSFAPLFIAGRAKTKKELAITGKNYYEALSSVKKVNPLSYLLPSLDKAKKQKIMKCAIGDAEISISDTGDVYPCHLLHIPQFFAGNIKEQSLDSIYRTSDKLKECRKLTVSEIEGCNKCDIRFICGGACRARAFFEKGKIDVSDDFCEYEKLAFTNGLFELHQFD